MTTIRTGDRALRASDLTVYLDQTSGSDSNDGLTTGTPFATFAKALDVVCGYDLNGFDAIIQLNDDTFTTAFDITQAWVGGRLIIRGNTTTPANTLLSTTSDDAMRIDLPLPWTLRLEGFKIQTTTAGYGVTFGASGLIEVGLDMDFGAVATGYAHLRAEGAGAKIQQVAAYDITGGGGQHYDARAGGLIYSLNQTVTITGTPAFTNAFAYASRGGTIWVQGATFSGSATGVRFDVYGGARIWTNGGGLTYFPGNEAGVISPGSVYDYIEAEPIAARGKTTNRYYNGFLSDLTGTSTLAVTANRLYGRLFIVNDRTLFNRIGIEITTGAGTNARLGIYRLDGSAHASSALVVDAGTVATGSAAKVEATISETLEPGVYVLAAVFDNTPTVRAANSGATAWAEGMLGDADAGTGSAAGAFYAAHTFGALPSTFGSPTYLPPSVGQLPTMWLRNV